MRDPPCIGWMLLRPQAIRVSGFAWIAEVLAWNSGREARINRAELTARAIVKAGCPYSEPTRVACSETTRFKGPPTSPMSPVWVNEVGVKSLNTSCHNIIFAPCEKTKFTVNCLPSHESLLR